MKFPISTIAQCFLIPTHTQTERAYLLEVGEKSVILFHSLAQILVLRYVYFVPLYNKTMQYLVLVHKFIATTYKHHSWHVLMNFYLLEDDNKRYILYPQLMHIKYFVLYYYLFTQCLAYQIINCLRSRPHFA